MKQGNLQKVSFSHDASDYMKFKKFASSTQQITKNQDGLKLKNILARAIQGKNFASPFHTTPTNQSRRTPDRRDDQKSCKTTFRPVSGMSIRSEIQTPKKMNEQLQIFQSTKLMSMQDQQDYDDYVQLGPVPSTRTKSKSKNKFLQSRLRGILRKCRETKSEAEQSKKEMLTQLKQIKTSVEIDVHKFKYAGIGRLCVAKITHSQTLHDLNYLMSFQMKQQQTDLLREIQKSELINITSYERQEKIDALEQRIESLLQ